MAEETSDGPEYSDKIFQAAAIGIVARAKSLNFTREQLLGAVAACWDTFEKHEPTLRKWAGFWDLIKAEAKTQRGPGSGGT
jgi:hypothetical protein